MSEPLDPTMVRLWSTAIEATERGDHRTLEAALEAQARIKQSIRIPTDKPASRGGVGSAPEAGRYGPL